jgi:NTP pyrophosphatase (non-canonical NTP hydrolase)
MSLHDMNLGEMVFDCTSDSNRWFPGEAQSLANQVLCMAGEVGEVANFVKKITRGSITEAEALDPEYTVNILGKDTLQEEVVDVLIYLCNLLGNPAFKDVDWQQVWEDKRDFNEQRFGTN